MSLRRTSRLLAVLGLAALPLLSACETAPATGRTIFTGGLSAEDESRLGYQEHQKIVPQFGGAYEDPAPVRGRGHRPAELPGQTGPGTRLAEVV